MSVSTYERITALIVEQLEKGAAPWRRPWGGQFQWPRNLSTLKQYRGVNVFLLSAQGFASPFWMTYRQAQQLGGHVRKGEHGAPVVFWKEWETEDRDTGAAAKIPVLRHYTVFHVSQIDGIDHLVPPGEVFDKPHTPIERCQQVVHDMPRRPTIRHDFDRAFYRPSDDMVGMPKIGAFDTAEGYHATLFHELGHSTGHKERLNRPTIVEAVHFGSENYGKEELVAEMTAAFLCGHTGIDPATLDNSAAYLAGWLRAIRKDARLIVTAASAAQRAADFILGQSFGQPASV